jgi:hypothetical protein
MAVAENPNKVANIVAGSHAGFEALYRPWLEARGLTVGCTYTKAQISVNLFCTNRGV